MSTSQQITIQLKDGRWLVNNKQLHECSDWERDFMNRFFQDFKSKNDDLQDN